jgi:hypothetical protein
VSSSLHCGLRLRPRASAQRRYVPGTPVRRRARA